jgi:hypothetical protein
MKGVTVELSTGATQKTSADGSFNFAKQAPGEYTLTPLSPDFNYEPGERTLSAKAKEMQYFYALPKPVQDTLAPNGTTLIEYKDTQGLPTRITFPEGLGEQQATVTPVLVHEPNGYLSTGHAMNIEVSGANAAAGVVGRDGEPLSIEIQIQYNNTDLQSLVDAGELVLLWQSPDGWIDATTTCPTGSEMDNNVQQNLITVPVCQWGTYALVAPVTRLYFPLLASDQ